MYTIPHGLPEKLTELLIAEDEQLAIVLMSSWLEGMVYCMDYTSASKIYDDMMEEFIVTTTNKKIDLATLGRFIVQITENVHIYDILSKKGAINIVPMTEDNVLVRH